MKQKKQYISPKIKVKKLKLELLSRMTILDPYLLACNDCGFNGICGGSQCPGYSCQVDECTGP